MIEVGLAVLNGLGCLGEKLGGGTSYIYQIYEIPVARSDWCFPVQ